MCPIRCGAKGGGREAKAPLKISKKVKMNKYGVFSCIKISFSVIFNEEIRLLGASMTILALKRLQLQRASPLTPSKGLCPLDPRRGASPWTPDVPSPPPPQRFTLAPPLCPILYKILVQAGYYLDNQLISVNINAFRAFSLVLSVNGTVYTQWGKRFITWWKTFFFCFLLTNKICAIKWHILFY